MIDPTDQYCSIELKPPTRLGLGSLGAGVDVEGVGETFFLEMFQ